MKKLAEQFLSQHEREKITETVQRMEQVTSGEIVPMVVTASHNYPTASVAGGLFLTIPLALLLTSLLGSTLWLGSQNMWLFLAFSAILFFPFRYLVSKNVTLTRMFLPGSQVQEEVEEAAITAFYGEGLYRTRDENGILVFVSVLERKVWILADRGINEKIEPDLWQDIVAELTRGIKTGKQGEALCQAITQVGNVLQDHFPIKEDDTDELRNIIIG
ncbi:TPM domain-containing protein [Desulforhopalus singaporensis]|uniref:Putative membrane protein n=1 Tax=Desulforhopalus singaporensis TaxID=91360 RepID=A0A1H0SEK6_9BACT|nr:TPM domain-containing protein [Desulforhopalus singaporensis]SDP39658.1 putative membrane protein [Desulforhopalus singaporensis]